MIGIGRRIYLKDKESLPECWMLLVGTFDGSLFLFFMFKFLSVVTLFKRMFQ